MPPLEARQSEKVFDVVAENANIRVVPPVRSTPDPALHGGVQWFCLHSKYAWKIVSAMTDMSANTAIVVDRDIFSFINVIFSRSSIVKFFVIEVYFFVSPVAIWFC